MGKIEKWPSFGVDCAENFVKLLFFDKKRLFFMIFVDFWRKVTETGKICQNTKWPNSWTPLCKLIPDHDVQEIDLEAS